MRNHQSNHGLPAGPPPRVPLGVNVQLYTQRVPGAGTMQVLQLADETGTLVVRFGLPAHVRRALARELSKPLSELVLPAGSNGDVNTPERVVDLVDDDEGEG